MRFLLASALKDLRRLTREPVTLAVWVGIPVMVAVLLSIVFGGGTVTPHGLLLVADEDQSFASSMLTGAFTQDRLAKMIAVEKVDRPEGRRRIGKGDGSALLIIPKGFGDAVLRNEPVRVSLITNPSQAILPGIIEEALSMMFDAVFYLQAIAGPELRTMAGRPAVGTRTFPDAGVASTAVSINRLVARVLPYLSPPLIKLDTTVVGETSKPSKSAAATFFPGMLFLAVFFLAQGMSDDLWREQSQGTLRRLATTPGQLWAFLAGKAAAVAGVLAVVGIVALAAGRWLLHISAANPPLAAAWIAGSGAVLFLLFVLLQSFASGQRAGNVLVSMFAFPLAMLGGSFFPFETMPATLASIGRWTPNGWALTRLTALLDNPVALPVARDFGLLALAGALAFVAVIGRVRSRFLV